MPLGGEPDCWITRPSNSQELRATVMSTRETDVAWRSPGYLDLGGRVNVSDSQVSRRWT